MIYIFILGVGIFLTPFIFYFIGLEPLKTKPAKLNAEADQKLNKSYKEQLIYP